MLAVSYNAVLVVGAVVLAVLSGFTGLSLTNGLSRLDVRARKPAIARAASILGGGIWSTHFVAMLALQLPVEVVYDPVYTLASALIAILMTGAALLLVHFGERTHRYIVAAGTIMGLGVVAMHYVGMYGMRGCLPVFGLPGYALSSLLAVLICIGAMQVAYRRRSLRGLVFGGTIYGIAILVMHFSAMSQTGFLPLDTVQPTLRMVPNDLLALLVILVAFVICGAFLLTTVTLKETPAPAGEDAPAPSEPSQGDSQKVGNEQLLRLPYESDGRTFFTPIEDVVAIQAEGHYTCLHRVSGKAFCPMAIAKLTEGLEGSSFLRTHRSYLVNINYVRGFERRKDQGVCLFGPDVKVDPVPVSRANVSATRRALGL